MSSLVCCRCPVCRPHEYAREEQRSEDAADENGDGHNQDPLHPSALIEHICENHTEGGDCAEEWKSHRSVRHHESGRHWQMDLKTLVNQCELEYSEAEPTEDDKERRSDRP